MNNELATTQSNYAVVAAIGSENIQSILEANLGGEQIDQFALDRVKVPGAGGIAWEVPTLEGVDMAKTVEGVIVGWKTVRSLYLTPFTGGGEPPVCASDNGTIGIGDPLEKGIAGQHDCYNCPHNQWQSAADGKGKKCSERRLVFMLRENDRLPIMISFPPTSIKPLSHYFLRLTQAGLYYWDVVTTLSLEKTKSQGGIDYSVIKPNVEKQLTPEESAAFKGYHEFFESRIMSSITFDSSLMED